MTDVGAATLPTPLIADISGYSHFVATRQGLFVVNAERATALAHGRFFGLAGRDNALYAFEHRDHAASPTRTGRILRFSIDTSRMRIDDVASIADGLDNGCHQIAFVGDDLYVVDTYNQRIALISDSRQPSYLSPLPPCSRGDPGYVHMNSILAHRDEIWLMLHNNGRIPSEVIRADRGLNVLERFAIDGYQCHDMAMLEDGDLLFCRSVDGALMTHGGRHVPIIPGLMTRGLSVDHRVIAVGSSLFGKRLIRHQLPGVVTFLDRDYAAVGHVALPGSPTDICGLGVS